MRFDEMKDKLYEAMAEFRIYHMLSDERWELCRNKDIAALWLQWRIDHNLPLKDKRWEFDAEFHEVAIHCLGIFYQGIYVGDLKLIGPVSEALDKILPKKKRA